MRRTIHAVLAVAILANIEVFAAELKPAKTPAALATWRAAIKPDAPPSDRKQAMASAEPTAKGSHTPAYYSAKRNVPPLPFNPFPDLPLFDLGDHNYVFDDSQVDYDTLQAGAKAMEDASELPVDQNEGMMSAMMAGALSVGITYSPPSGFLLDVLNMNPGGVYGVGAKALMDTDPFNTWSLVSVFQAEAANEQLEGNASAPARFYNAVDLDSYSGPLVEIVSPGDGSTVNGDVVVHIRVTDVLPILSVRIYVDAILAGVVQPGDDGRIVLPTSRFANGQHQIWVEVVNEGVPVDTDGDTVVDETSTFQSWASVDVSFSNGVFMQNYSPLYSQAGSIVLQYGAVTPHSYVFEVFTLQGGLLHASSGQSVAGVINAQWNYTDLNGQPVSDAGYVFSLSFTPLGGGQILAAATQTIMTTNYVDHGVNVGKYVTSYGTWPSSGLNSGLANMNAAVSVRVNAAAFFSDDIVGQGREAYNPVHADFSSDPIAIVKATETSDLLALKNALSDLFTGSWLFDGHSGPLNIIPGLDGYLTVSLTAQEIAGLLGNEYGFSRDGYSLKYDRRLFSTMITGCSAAAGGSKLPEATGTPAGIQQVGNSQIKKSAYIAFTGLSYAGAEKFGWIARIHQEWLDGNDYDTPLNTALVIANNTYPAVVSWGPTLLGYNVLEYNANESR